MTFDEVMAKASTDDKIRRVRWPDGVCGTVTKEGWIMWGHVAACALRTPPAEDFSMDDWIIIEDYGRDISYRMYV